jgi:hypothetical protein
MNKWGSPPLEGWSFRGGTLRAGSEFRELSLFTSGHFPDHALDVVLDGNVADCSEFYRPADRGDRTKGLFQAHPRGQLFQNQVLFLQLSEVLILLIGPHHHHRETIPLNDQMFIAAIWWPLNRLGRRALVDRYHFEANNSGQVIHELRR